jgi:pSer/pThr/pTyr-binding forkhead associated (FHA) protein
MEKITVTLIPENGSFQGKRTVIVSQPITLGRLMENQEQQTTNFLRFNSKVVSRQHARLLQQDGKVLLRFATNYSSTSKILRAPVGRS